MTTRPAKPEVKKKPPSPKTTSLIPDHRHDLALDEHAALQVGIHRMTGWARLLVGKHREPFLVDGVALRAVLHEDRHLDDVLGRAVGRLDDAADVMEHEAALLLEAGRELPRRR